MDDKQKKKKRQQTREYPMEVIETAENLYIYKHKTHEEISKVIDVPVVTIQRWSDKYEWRKAKLDAIKQRVNYRRDLYVLRDQIFKKAKESNDHQVIYALANLQRIIEAEEKMKPMEDLPADPAKATGLSEETLAKIKEEIYGIHTEGSNQKT
jgi:hypothetical protein